MCPVDRMPADSPSLGRIDFRESVDLGAGPWYFNSQVHQVVRQLWQLCNRTILSSFTERPDASSDRLGQRQRD